MFTSPNFDPDIKWFKGAGCMICGRNVCASGEKLGYHCVDLDVDVDMDGRFGLCTDCAREVGHQAGMVSIDVVDERANQVAEALTLALENNTAAQQAASQARLDRDVVERLMNLVPAGHDEEASTR